VTYPWVYMQVRDIPGGQWLAMGEDERSYARRELRGKVRQLALDNGLPGNGNVSEETHVDEKAGMVRLVAELIVLGPEPEGRLVAGEDLP
jgi:hypothetical protein